MSVIVFELPLVPRPWKRPRAVALKGLKGVRMFSHRDQETHFRDVISLASQHRPSAPLVGPLVVSLVFRLPILASWPSWKQSAAIAGIVLPTGPRNDIDNLAKGVLDALTRGGQFWRDDGQVVALHARKRFASRPGISVEIKELPGVSSAAEWKGHRDAIARRAKLAWAEGVLDGAQPRVRPGLVRPGEDDPRTEARL